MSSRRKTPMPRADDPPPQPPIEPDLEACCGQGCNPCVFDLYEQARERYREALRAWQERQAERAARVSGRDA